MKRVRFTEEQIIAVLREQEAGARWLIWRASTGSRKLPCTTGRPNTVGMEVSEAKRLKALEDENRKLKKLLAELMLDQAALKRTSVKKMVGPAAKREAVAHLRRRVGA